jgi:hypothetical protein
MKDYELIGALKILAMTNEERMEIFAFHDALLNHATSLWFLEHIDELAPELHSRGWVTYSEFKHEPGCVVVTDGLGHLQKIVITELGRKQINAATQ